EPERAVPVGNRPVRVVAVREGVGEEPGDGGGAGNPQAGTATREPRHHDDRGKIEQERCELGTGREVEVAQPGHGDESGSHDGPRRACAERTGDAYPPRGSVGEKITPGAGGGGRGGGGAEDRRAR